MKIRIGTRKSKLAMVQTGLVQEAILRTFPEMEIEVVPMSTRGDQLLDRSLTSFGGKGVFTKELEDALLDGRIDMAVHSAKDMPMEFPDGLGIGAVLERADVRDVLVTVDGTAARDLPPGSVVGTSSLRRELQMKQINPQVQVRMLRGNIQTRLDKLKHGEYDAIILAAAGLARLGLLDTEDFCLEYLDLNTFIPAPGQGILAVECRNGALSDVMAAIHSVRTSAMLQAERLFLTVMGGGCNAPCGAYCRIETERLLMDVMYAGDGKNPLYQHRDGDVREDDGGVGDDALVMARELAGCLRCRPVSLVGAGPGDTGLMTRRGLECIRQADVIVYDNLVSLSLLNEARLDAEIIYAGKRATRHYKKQSEINDILIEKALTGSYVVRLKGGDPYIFGRGGEEAQELKKHGIPFEIVPGVSSCYSVPAYAGIPVTHREAASSFHVITGHGSADKKDLLDYETLAKMEGTLIFLMGLKNLETITSQLIRHGKPKETPAAVIEQGTTARQRSVMAPLAELDQAAQTQGIKTPALLVIGDVVGLGEELAWISEKPLSHKRVVVTGSRQVIKEIEKELLPLGAEVVAVSLIENRPVSDNELEQWLEQLDSFTWLVFSSACSIHTFFDVLKQQDIDLRGLSHMRFAVVGRKTGEALREHGFRYDFVPDNFTGAELARTWIPTLCQDDRILLIRAREGNMAIAEALSRNGSRFEDCAIYESWTDERRGPELNRAAQDADYVVLASGSAAKICARLLEPELSANTVFVSIGPTTTEEAKIAGLEITRTAAEHTAAGIAAAIKADVMESQGIMR
ncbi:MAG: hydroxymethylbilane synthase [Lachnospiraceae bacterium]